MKMPAGNFATSAKDWPHASRELTIKGFTQSKFTDNDGNPVYEIHFVEVEEFFRLGNPHWQFMRTGWKTDDTDDVVGFRVLIAREPMELDGRPSLRMHLVENDASVNVRGAATANRALKEVREVPPADDPFGGGNADPFGGNGHADDPDAIFVELSQAIGRCDTKTELATVRARAVQAYQAKSLNDGHIARLKPLLIAAEAVAF